jgi:MGT family glycosyltransferase
MPSLLAYTSPAAGHLFPLLPGLHELQRRGHDVQLRTAPHLVEAARTAGLDAEPIDARIPGMRSSTRRDANRLRHGLAALMARGEAEREDLQGAIAEVDPDVVLVDTNAYGAAVAAERSGRPWATTLPSLLPLPGPGIPPYGFGLRPLHGPLGRLRDRVLWRAAERLYAQAMLPRLNTIRSHAGLPALQSPLEHLLAPDRLIVLTGDPLEYPRSDLPENVRFVGAQLWEPQAPPPPWLLEEGDPWVLVTCSTGYQRDESLAAAAIEALADEPVRVVVTLADAHRFADQLAAPPNARIERFTPHTPLLDRAAAVICHAGMGIVQKAIWAAVPIVAVPFARDQPEIARRIVECGAGVRLSRKRLNPRRMRHALRDAIKLGPDARTASARIRAAGGPSRFADAAEELAE